MKWTSEVPKRHNAASLRWEGQIFDGSSGDLITSTEVMKRINKLETALRKIIEQLPGESGLMRMIAEKAVKP